MNANIEETYHIDEYYRSKKAYKLFLSSLEAVFNFSIVDSFLDLGCINGSLIAEIKKSYSHVNVVGVDYFAWAKEAAAESVRDKIVLADLSQDFDLHQKYDIVNCTELGEHIEKDREAVFLANVVKHVNDILILSWSNQPAEQHLNPRPKDYIIKCVERLGLSYWPSASRNLAVSLKDNLEIFETYYWWSDNILVFKRQTFAKLNGDYFIQSIQTDELSESLAFKKGGLYKTDLQSAFLSLCLTIKGLVSVGQSKIFLKTGDGDYYFLRKLPFGSAKPGQRALTKNYNQIRIKYFENNFWKADFISYEILDKYYRMWLSYLSYHYFDHSVDGLMSFLASRVSWFKVNSHRILPRIKNLSFVNFILSRVLLARLTAIFIYSTKGLFRYKKVVSLINKDYIPSEALYALVATKWIFKNYPNEIGIIGNEKKLELISLLSEHEEYRAYLGINKFSDYITIPQKGAADDVVALSELIGEKLLTSNAKIFLVGIGHVKSALLPMLKQYSNAIFIDVGAGIDAIAGVICQQRPYFADWTNYRLRSYDYTTVDFMDQGSPAWDNQDYKTKYID